MTAEYAEGRGAAVGRNQRVHTKLAVSRSETATEKRQQPVLPPKNLLRKQAFTMLPCREKDNDQIVSASPPRTPR